MMNEPHIPFRWMNLSNHEALKVRQILETTGGGWVAKKLNKRLSIPISIYLARWGVSPNHITLFNLILGILSGVLASFGDYGYLLAGGILFQWVSILDGCDGEVAKLNGKATRFGAWFDTVGDNLSFVVFVVGVTFGFYQKTHAYWVLALAEIALVSFAVLLSIMVSYLLRKQDGKASLTTYEKEVLNASLAGQTGWVATFMSRGKFLIKKDFFALLFSLLAVINFPQGIVFFAALGSGAVALILSVLTLKQWRVRKAALPRQITEISQ
jgi:phosphatidylglycerophosphate synthase